MLRKAEGGPCRPCDVFWGAIGVCAALVLLYVGADLISGGALTAAISGRRTEEGVDDEPE